MRLEVNAKPVGHLKDFGTVDIIVPYHGAYEHVGNLLKSLWSHSVNFQNKVALTGGVRYKLFLVDDGSPNQSFLAEILGCGYPGVKGIRTEHRGFGAAVNAGLSATDSAWVAVLNSDVVIQDGLWLRNLVEGYARLRGQKVKMVSARTDRVPSGDPRVATAGGDVVLEAGSVAEMVRTDCFLPWVCVLTNRQLFKKVGRLREYPYGGYEDLEFAARMHTAGFRQAICGSTFVRHENGVTFAEVVGRQPRISSVIEGNYDLVCKDLVSIS